MSSLLTLATDLEQKSKAQASDTEQMLKRAFSEHELSISAALSLSVLLTATCGSVLWYQSTLIRSNLAELQAQSAALEKLTARTWGVTY
ncbi:MbeB family mobilization protein [Pectobacterium carotovorum]